MGPCKQPMSLDTGENPGLLSSSSISKDENGRSNKQAAMTGAGQSTSHGPVAWPQPVSTWLDILTMSNAYIVKVYCENGKWGKIP
jgi:hypothetical protein